ncbi:hypothetical protein GCM10023313_07160 [Mucilaginibacter defluvii]|uniref:Uncharacterized protein n=1 Tax=Mucilaginibacter defluvii TaxID=1196019 RepID=A0ABP9FKZ9_9SPHI
MNLNQIYTEILHVIGNHINGCFEFGITSKIGVKSENLSTYFWYGTEPIKNKEIYNNICDLYKLSINTNQTGNYLYVKFEND